MNPRQEKDPMSAVTGKTGNPVPGYWELGSVRLFTSAKLSGVNSVVESRFPELKRLRGV